MPGLPPRERGRTDAGKASDRSTRKQEPRVHRGAPDWPLWVSLPAAHPAPGSPGLTPGASHPNSVERSLWKSVRIPQIKHPHVWGSVGVGKDGQWVSARVSQTDQPGNTSSGNAPNVQILIDSQAMVSTKYCCN